MSEIYCPLCGKSRTVSPNELLNCLCCTAEIRTDNEARIAKVQIRPERLFAELKSLASRGKESEAEALLDTLLSNTMYDNDNRVRVTKARDMFAQWLSRR